MAIDMWNIDKRYYNIDNLPNSRNEWVSLINNKYRNIYRNELSNFLSDKNGRILNLITGMDTIIKEYNTKIYSGLFEIVELIYGVDISTNKLIKSIKVLFNWTKLNFLTTKTIANVVTVTNIGNGLEKRCPLCNCRRSSSNFHLIWTCKALDMIRNKNLTWTKKTDYTGNILFLEEVQRKINEI